MSARRLCFIGDSVMLGTEDGEYRGWPGRLCAAERASGHDITLYNLGVRADTSALIAGRWRAECDVRLPDTVAGGLIFAFGVNDTAIANGVGVRVPRPRSLELARDILRNARSWRPVLWVGPCPVDESKQPLQPGTGDTYDFNNSRIGELSTAYMSLAEELNVPFLDLFTDLSGDPAWRAALVAGDGVHPTPDAYGLIAGRVGVWPAWRTWFDAQPSSESAASAAS